MSFLNYQTIVEHLPLILHQTFHHLNQRSLLYPALRLLLDFEQFFEHYFVMFVPDQNQCHQNRIHRIRPVSGQNKNDKNCK